MALNDVERSKCTIIGNQEYNSLESQRSAHVSPTDLVVFHMANKSVNSLSVNIIDCLNEVYRRN